MIYRTDGTSDSFGSLSFRQVLAATFPGGPTPDDLKRQDVFIEHITGHQLAIVELKVMLCNSRLLDPSLDHGVASCQ